MIKSESIKELATALAKAQAEIVSPEASMAEGSIIRSIVKTLRPRNGVNQKSGKSPLDLFMAKVAFGSSVCWHWTGAMHKLGYGISALLGENKAHRVSWRLFNGDIPQGMNVLHRCDVRCCVNPDHLFIGTQRDNVRDMVRKNRKRNANINGERNPMAKLSSKDVTAMRELRANTSEPYNSIAKRFGVSTMTAYRAINNQSWSMA